MAPSIEVASPTPAHAPVEPKDDPKATASGYIREPLKYSGSLDVFKSFDVTPIIGREFPDLQLTDTLNDDQKIHDLAITVSRRGVVFFRNQRISSDEQKELGQKLDELTGKPATSKARSLYRHAVNNAVNNAGRKLTVNELVKLDDEISVISSETNRKYYGDRFANNTRHLASEGWNADITFEWVPSNYAILKITHSPEDQTGGDTLWASGYEVYDRLSPPIQGLADTLTAVHHQPSFNNIAKDMASNSFKEIEAPLRTPAVNGWIEGMTKRESENLKKYYTLAFGPSL
ncbi:hypothetical protein BDW71DRAFT_205662 [Aspergillus fruticulosus]